MARSFVLIDTLPNREQEVFENLGSIPGVLSRRILKQKVGPMGIMILVEAPDTASIEKLVGGQIRNVPWVRSVQRVMPQHTILAPMSAAMAEIERELAARGA